MDGVRIVLQNILSIAKTDPVSFTSVVIVLIGFAIYEPGLVLSTLTGIGLLGLLFGIYRWWTTSNSKKPYSTSKPPSSSSTKSSSSSSTPLKSVWDFNRALGRDSQGDAKKSHDDKPFGSSYYYAHNNPNATGGYKDGLKMEDYTMNGPRLLSKGGLPVKEGEQNVESETMISGTSSTGSGDGSSDAAVAAKSSVSSSNETPPPVSKPATNITKYLWDDPGTGIATIRIDQLPIGNIGGMGGSKVGTMIDWKDVQVLDVTSKLAGEGLLVKIETEGHGSYQLKIPKLYGDAAKVECIRKTKRLLVKIHKKKNAVLSWMSSSSNKSNMDSWPQPHRKV